MEWPNITIYVPAVDAQTLIDAANARMLDYDAPALKTGSIELIAPDKSLLCTISLVGVDITTAEPQKLDATAESMYIVKCQLQVESMTFKFEAEATVPPSA
jgi:hypothetical protein